MVHYPQVVEAVVVCEDYRQQMLCLFSNDEVKVVFAWYADEISFSASEVIGLEEDECHKLFHERDIAYLRS